PHLSHRGSPAYPPEKSNGRPDKLGLGPIVAQCPSRANGQMTVVIIDRRELYRECLASALTARRSDWVAVTVSNVAEWLKSAPFEPGPAVILFCIGSDSEVEIHEQLELLQQAEHVPPVALLAQKEDSDQVVAALNQGVRAYIPTNATL